MCNEFGIVTGPADQHIPDIVYDLPELQNNPDGGSRRPAKRRRIVSTLQNLVNYVLKKCECVLVLIFFFVS